MPPTHRTTEIRLLFVNRLHTFVVFYGRPLDALLYIFYLFYPNIKIEFKFKMKLIYNQIMTEGNNKNTSATGSVSVVGVIQIVFIVLKLTHNKVIGTWPWWKVCLPIIVSASLALCLCCCGVACICIATSLSPPEEKKTRIEIFHTEMDPVKLTRVVQDDIESELKTDV